MKFSKRGKQILISWAIIAAMFLTLGLLIGSCAATPKKDKATQTTKDTSVATQTTQATPTTQTTQATPTTQTTPTDKPTEAPKIAYAYLGEYKLTAYCACEKCCGKWAEKRPVDSDGKPIVYTANESIAEQGVTVAADTDILPFGTVLVIGDHEYIVQDRGSSVEGKHIDIYFESHEEAVEFGVQYMDVFEKVEGL